MYIEFRLPDLPKKDGSGVYVAINCINEDIAAWAEKHEINYKVKQHKLTYRLILPNEQAYSHFALTWNPRWRSSTHFSFKQPK